MTKKNNLQEIMDIQAKDKILEQFDDNFADMKDEQDLLVDQDINAETLDQIEIEDLDHNRDDLDLSMEEEKEMM